MYTFSEVATDFGPTKVCELSTTSEAEGYTTAQVLGELSTLAAIPDGPLVRMQLRCLYGEPFASRECDCGPQLEASRKRIAVEGLGILFYLHDQEGQGADLRVKALGHSLAEREDLGTFEAYKHLGLSADQRAYECCGRFLQWARIRHVRLLTNNPDKALALRSWVDEVKRIPLEVAIRAREQRV